MGTPAGDTEHGAASIPARALEVLRDEAALATTGLDEDGWRELTALARRLRDTRPAMTVVANRTNRAIDEADRTPGAVERAASAGIERALRATDRVGESRGSARRHADYRRRPGNGGDPCRRVRTPASSRVGRVTP